MIIGNLIPNVLADRSKIYVDSFDRGITWKPYVPIKKTTFVNLDKNSYIDDYAYLAAIPNSVFYDKNQGEIFTNPLIFYEEEYPSEKYKERSLNARQGIDYFMEDWINFNGNNLDQITLINVPKNIDNDWRAKEKIFIESNDPYHIASNLAIHDWSYSDNAVIAVIDEEFEKPDNVTHGVITGSVPNKEIKKEHFEVQKTNEVYPDYNNFYVPEGYKFLKVRSWYPCFYIDAGVPGFEGIINMSIPAGDRDLQIYCKYNGEWMMAGITNAWNAQGGMDLDKTSVYVYKSGDWSVALTDVPTKSMGNYDFEPGKIIKTGLEQQKHRKIGPIGFGRYGRILEILLNMQKVTYQVDIEMYPGIMKEIPVNPPFGCRHAQFELSWNNPDVDLGISLIGPEGEEILSTREEGVRTSCHFTEQEEYLQTYDEDQTGMIIERLGELKPGEHYSICVFSTTELSSDVDFALEYSWEQNYTKREGDALASATEGAVLGSLLNAPLLYTKPSKLNNFTENALNKLGVKNIFVVDLGSYLSNSVKNELKEISKIKEHFIYYSDIYDFIRKFDNHGAGRSDIIFSTIDPFSYWHIAEFDIAGEWPGALAIGPAAYLAAHHGSPVIIIDNHPELSSALVWHNEFWKRYPDGFTKLPTVSEMFLTGKRVYNFLDQLGYDQENEEVIVTVGGQFDIGLTWDRVFVGKGIPGRFIGSPTDLSVWISKTIFYPQLVFENPALQKPNGYKLINGSRSIRRFPWRGKLGLKITKPSQEETFKFPVLDTLVCYDHKFNSRASKYWGFEYKTADGDIPGKTQSFEPIDEGVMIAVNGQEGGFFPDLSGSEVQPFYLKKAGYSPVYSTNFNANMENINRGVLLWLLNTHGGSVDGGVLMFWDTQREGLGYPAIPFAGYNKETNPWRGYEWNMGSTEEPDTMTSEIHGILPALAGNPNPLGIRILATALDWANARRPIRDIIGKIASLPIIRFFAPDWLQDTQDYYDGVIISLLLSRFGTSWYNGTQIDDALGNIHSVGVSSVACLPAGKFLHMSLMRHGSVFQIMDPWATSWYSDVWQNGVPRGIAIGKTIGEIYAEGISKVGILYISDPPQWWWDLAENVCLYGDPNLRIWVPQNEYSNINHWSITDVESLKYDENEGFYVDGHNPFGTENHPNATEPTSLIEQLIWIVIIAAILITIIIGVILLIKKKHR